jgi:DNA segregation ATPase FtsK/SpoIIIE-like protein
MVSEFIIAGLGLLAIENFYKIRIRLKWRQITHSSTSFTNNLDKTLLIHSIKATEYGNIIRIELPYSYTFTQFEKDLDVFKEGMQYKSIQLEQDNNIVDMYCVKDYKFKDYVPIQLRPNKLLIADGLTQPIIVDMNKFPHVLIGGDTGTGKSRILLLILTNLIKYCDNVDIYMLQIRKNDLGVFNNCSQIKCNSKTLEEVLESLRKIDMECKRRERLIDNTKGFYNIEDYNKNNKKLNYVYVVIEEFSFLNISRGDTKEEKLIKSQCLKHIKTIVNVGRSSGVFLITALQKPTNDSIPTDIKAQLCARISLKIADSPAAIVIMGNDKPTKLQERELIVRTLDEQQGYSYTINHEIITENIKDKVVVKPEVQFVKSEPPKPKSIQDILNAINGS